MSGESERIERLVKMANRLIEAVETDIAALKAGQPQAMRTTDPEMQRLCALYSGEAQKFSLEALKDLPLQLRSRFIETTRNFRDLLSACPHDKASAQRQRRDDQGDCRRSRSPGGADAHLFARSGGLCAACTGDDLQQRDLSYASRLNARLPAAICDWR